MVVRKDNEEKIKEVDVKTRGVGVLGKVARKAPGQRELLKKNAKEMRWGWGYTWRVVGTVRRSVAFPRQMLPKNLSWAWSL